MSDDSGAPKNGNGSKKKAAPAHLKPVGDATPLTVSPKDIEDLERSGLTEETIELSRIHSEGKSPPIAEILGWKWKNGGGMVLPFFDYDSNKLLLCRVKPHQPRMRTKGAKSKPVKYEQRPGSGAIPYIGPRCIQKQMLEGMGLVLWPEGEKKTLLLDQLGYACIGLTGCHNWNDPEKYANGDGLTWSKWLRKYAERFVRGRHHVIMFDSDCFSKDAVMLAMRRLAGLLYEGGALSVRFGRIPPDANDASRGVGIDDFFVEHGEEKTREIIKAAELIKAGEEVTPIAPKDPLLKLNSLAWLKGANLDADLRLPPRFEIRRDRSLWQEPPIDKPEADQKEIARAAILPARMLDALVGEDQRLEIAYYARGKWHRGVIDRRAIRDARRALAELPPGAAIDSNNAPLVVLWLGEYMRHNEHRMSAKRFTNACGWQDLDDERCFMLAEPVTTSNAPTIVPDEAGDKGEILRALKPRGTYPAHLAALRSAFAEDPIAALGILGALSAPLLKPLGAPNFAVHFYGDSSRGKTTMLKLSASVFGNPSSEGYVGSWNATPVAMELRAATLCDLPMPMDEVGAGDMKDNSRMVYMMINGIGKARGSRGLKVQRTAFWRTVVVSTGEHELVDDKANTGAQVRALQFRVSKFGDFDGARVDKIREDIEQNFGHVGLEWIKHLVAVEDWEPLRQLFARAKVLFRSKEKGSLMQRQAIYYALLATTEHIAHEVLGLGKTKGGTVREIFANADQRRELKTASERAVEVVSEWIAAEPLTFPCLDYNSTGGLIAKTVASVKKINGVRHRGHVCFLPNELRVRLAQSGISAAEVIHAWKDLGWLDVDERRTTKRLSWDNKRVRLVCVSCDALGLDAAESTEAQTRVDFKD